MGFPIAIGTKSVASRRISAPQPIEEYDDDGCVLRPSLPTAPATLSVTSADQELLALITLYYYNMCRKEDDSIAYCVAEIHVQISLLAEATSMASRDVMHRVPLPSPIDDTALDHSYPTTQMAVFSSDRRSLTCLIPHPLFPSCSAVIVFQLRRSKIKVKERNPEGPPLPAYIAPTTLEIPIVPIATNPTILLTSEKVPLLHATAICNVQAAVGPLVPGLLLVGCQDGSIQVATYGSSPGICSGELHPADGAAVRQLDHWSEWRDEREQTMVGRLAVVWTDGTIMAFRSHFTEHLEEMHDPLSRSVSSFGNTEEEEEAADFSFGLIPTHDFRNDRDGLRVGPMTQTIVSVRWIAGSYLAVLETPTTHCTAHVVGLYDFGKCAAVSTITVTSDQLDESLEAIFHLSSFEALDNWNVEQSSHESDNLHRMALDYDAHSDCLAITSFLHANDNRSRCFVCLWNWRVNVLGLIAPLIRDPEYDSIDCGTLYFAVDHAKRRKIVYVTAIPTQQHLRFCKAMYDIAILSPPYEPVIHRCKLRQTSSLLLSSESVSFPQCTKNFPASEHFEMEWMEAEIPKQYLLSFGAPVLSSMGRDLGRSIAVASARGFCVLDRSGSRITDNETVSAEPNLSAPEDVMMKLLRSGSIPPRWRLFANEMHERAFRVVAMTWWEGFIEQKSNLADADDILVAIIEVLDSHDACHGYYLSSWSGRDVELPSQLLRLSACTNGDSKGVHWGIPLPPDFVPECIDLLACPILAHGSRLATVLLADSTSTTKYYVYMLQVIPPDIRYKGSNNYAIECRCIAYGNVGSPSELFLASASFCSSSRDDKEASEEFAVLGVLRKYGGGLDALSVCSSSIVSVGQVIESADHGADEPRSAEISRYWLADVVPDDKLKPSNSGHLFVWTLQLACGRLINWSVPFMKSMDELNFSVRLLGMNEHSSASSMVHPKSIVLGLVCPAGTGTNWMQQSSVGAQCDFLCGSIPTSSKGYILGVSQSVQIIRSPLAAGDVDPHGFWSSVMDRVVLRPSDFKLYPPGFLPSLYVLAIEAGVAPDSASIHSGLFQRQFHRKIECLSLQDMSVMSIQLIVLRLVEKLAVISKTNQSTHVKKYRRLRRILNQVVAVVRRQTTALQFAALFLQLGRQMEPSCLPHLFPLPETVEDLFSIALTSGSVATAVSAIPVLQDSKPSMLKCTSLFHYCIHQFDASFGRTGISYDIGLCLEELETTGGLFRYALKVQRRHAEDHHLPDNGNLGNDDVAPTSRYSIMCGITNIFRGRAKPSPKTSASATMDESPLLVHGITDDRIKKLTGIGVDNIRRLTVWKDLPLDNMCVKSVPALMARYVVSCLFGGSAFDTSIGWRKLAALATLLMRDVVQSDFGNCSVPMASMLQRIKGHRWVSLVPVDIRRGGMTHALEYCIENCSLDVEFARQVLDLFLVLLLECDTRHFGSDQPGLLLSAVVAAHVSNRISEVLAPTHDDELTSAYFELFPVLPQTTGSTTEDMLIIV